MHLREKDHIKMKGNVVRNEGNFLSEEKRHQENATRPRFWVSNAELPLKA